MVIWDKLGFKAPFPLRSITAALLKEDPTAGDEPRQVTMIADGLEEVYRAAVETLPNNDFSKDLLGTLSLTPTPEKLRGFVYQATELLWGRLDFGVFPAEEAKKALDKAPLE